MLTIFAKLFVLDVWQGSEDVSTVQLPLFRGSLIAVSTKCLWKLFLAFFQALDYLICSWPKTLDILVLWQPFCCCINQLLNNVCVLSFPPAQRSPAFQHCLPKPLKKQNGNKEYIEKCNFLASWRILKLLKDKVMNGEHGLTVNMVNMD